MAACKSERPLTHRLTNARKLFDRERHSILHSSTPGMHNNSYSLHEAQKQHSNVPITEIITAYSHYTVCDSVAVRVERETSDREVADSTPTRALLCNNLRQVVHALVPLSPNSISWYWCRSLESSSRSWKRCGQPPITLSVSSLPAQDHGNRHERHTRMSHQL